MKELVGKIICVRYDGQSVKGKMIADYQDRIVLVLDNPKDKNTLVVNINKAAIAGFTINDPRPLAEIEKMAGYASGIPLTVLACQNKGIKCPGVKFVINKFDKDIKKEDFEPFMCQCPLKQATCKFGIVGNVAKLEAKTQINMLAGHIFGDYPTSAPAIQPPQ